MSEETLSELKSVSVEDSVPKQQQTAATHLSYWRTQLSGQLPTLQWPSDQPRPVQQTYVGESRRFRISQALADSLKILGKKNGASLNVTLLAGFATLLFRYTGQNDLILGGVSILQKPSETERLAGCFLNPLPLRLNLSHNPSFIRLLKHVRGVFLDAMAHDEVLFSEIVEAVNPPPDPGRHPLVQITVGMRPESISPPPGWNLEVHEVVNGGSKLDLTVMFNPQPDGIEALITYNADLFREGTIPRFFGHYRTLLEEIVNDPTKGITEFEIVDEAEQRQLRQFNATVVDYAERERTLHELIEEQVERTPNAVALVYEGQRLSYRELNARANQLAHYLTKLGVGPDMLVGVCLERSIELEIGLLGVLKAGGAYVPLDPDYPEGRLGMMLEDAQPVVVLTAARLERRLPKHGGRTVSLDRDWSEIRTESVANPRVKLAPTGAAYAIYTSGSTGKPKGVVNVHEGIVNRLLWMQSEYKLGGEDRVLQKTASSFDVSVWEFFWPLMTGARLVMARPGGHRDPKYLGQVIDKEGITTVHFVPSMLRAYIEAGELRKGSSIRRVFCSGEALPKDVEKRFFECSDAELHNLYGPTEAAVDVTYWKCHPGDKRPYVPIGRPIANMQIRILDGRLGLVPIGVPGELHIAGIGLARGYLNRPELTAERFVEDPFGTEPGARLYKTGDLARWRESGEIEYLGRIDHQVKLRGYRIELGEIETGLRKHFAIREAVAAIKNTGHGEPTLVAYVVMNEAAAATNDELRTHLKQFLPEYMVPSAIVTLSELPLTLNGKIDRKALPDLDRQNTPSAPDLAPSGSETERKLAEVFQRVLRSGPVNVSASFFDLGGDSLLALKLFSEISKTFGKDVPASTIFEAPSVERLALVLEQHGASGSQSLFAIQPRGTLPPLFFVHSPIAMHHALAALLGPDQPLYGFQQRGLDGQGEPLTRIEDMARTYIAELRSARPQGPYHLAGACLGGMVALEMAQQLRAEGQEVGLLLLVDSFFPGRLKDFRDDSLRPRLIWRFDNKIGEILMDAGPGPLGYAIAFRKAIRRFFAERARSRALAKVDQANAQAISAYVPKPYGGRLVLFWATDASFRAYQDRRLAWSSIAEQGLEVHIVAGNHLSIMEPPKLTDFANKLKICLQRSGFH